MGKLFRFRSKKQSITLLRGFSLLELIFIVIILTLITIPITSIRTSSLEEARDQLISDIRYVQTTAMLNSKFYSIPEDDSVLEERKAKFWFKSRWQLYITNTGDKIYYQIFSDSATVNSRSFDKNVNAIKYSYELLNNHYEKTEMTGKYKEETQSSAVYKEDAKLSLNLTDFYGIKKVEINSSSYSLSSMGEQGVLGDRIRLIFDYLGRPYFNYDKFDKGGYYPFSYSNKNALIHNSFKVKLSNSEDEVCFTVEGFTGYTYPSDCW